MNHGDILQVRHELENVRGLALQRGAQIKHSSRVIHFCTRQYPKRIYFPLLDMLFMRRQGFLSEGNKLQTWGFETQNQGAGTRLNGAPNTVNAGLNMDILCHITDAVGCCSWRQV